MSNLYLQLPTFTILYQLPQPKAAFKNIHKIQTLQVTGSCRFGGGGGRGILIAGQAKINLSLSPKLTQNKYSQVKCWFTKNFVLIFRKKKPQTNQNNWIPVQELANHHHNFQPKLHFNCQRTEVYGEAGKMHPQCNALHSLLHQHSLLAVSCER